MKQSPDSFSNRLISSLTGEPPEVRYARQIAMRGPGIQLVRDRLFAVMSAHWDRYFEDNFRRFEFEGRRINTLLKFDFERGLPVRRLTISVDGTDSVNLSLRFRAIEERGGVMVPARVIDVITPDNGLDRLGAKSIQGIMADLDGRLGRFATHYLNTKVEKWNEMIDGEHMLRGNCEPHVRPPEDQRWIPDVDRDLDRLQKAYTHATSGLNEARLDASGVQEILDRIQLLCRERHPMLRRYYRERGRDLDKILGYRPEWDKPDPEPECSGPSPY